MGIIEAVAIIATAIGSLGWIVAFFRFSSENKRDQAAATKSLQEVNGMLLAEYATLLKIKNEENAALRRKIEQNERDFAMLATEHQTTISERDQAVHENAELYALIDELEQKKWELDDE